MSHRRRNGKKGRILILILAILAVLAIVGHFSYPYLEIYYNRFFGGNGEETLGPAQPMQKYRDQYPQYNTFGIDVSEYQKSIDWETVADKNELDFVIVRASAGSDHKDRKFDFNWRQLKKYNIVRGAYHYYRPNENSTEQAEQFTSSVVLEKGDIVPILDIEKYSNIQSISSLQNGLLNWLNIVEEYYGIVPMIYTYSDFYMKVLKDDKRFSKYPVWIAHYSSEENPKKLPSGWLIWQFSENGRLEGIETYVDIDVCSDAKKLQSHRK